MPNTLSAPFNFIGQTWRVGQIGMRTETHEAISGALALKKSIEQPELWYANFGTECTPVLWPTDRLHGLAHLIEEKRAEEIIWVQPPPEGFIESALWGLKRIQEALAKKLTSIQWQGAQLNKTVTPIINNPGDVKFAAEYYQDHPTLVHTMISGFVSIKDYFARRSFRNEHADDYMVYLNAEKYENAELQWVNIPKGLEKEIYHEMKNIPRLAEPLQAGLFSRVLSGLAAPFIFFKNLSDDFKVLNARKDAKKVLMDSNEFPGFDLLIKHDNKLAEDIKNELARILLEKNEKAITLSEEIKRRISNSAKEIKLNIEKDKIMLNFEKAINNKSKIHTEVTSSESKFSENKQLIEKTLTGIDHERERVLWARDALELAAKKIKSNPENGDIIKAKTIPKFEEQLKAALISESELTLLLKKLRVDQVGIESNISSLNNKLDNMEIPYSNECIKAFEGRLKGLDDNTAEYIRKTIQTAPTIEAINDETLTVFLNAALHPNFINLPQNAKDQLYLYILNSKHDLNDTYNNFLLPLLEIAKPGIQYINNDVREKWYSTLFNISDKILLKSKIKVIENNISDKLQTEARKILNLGSSEFWKKTVKTLNLSETPILNEHEKLFNDRIIEQSVIHDLIETLALELLNNGSLSEQSKAKIPELIQKHTGDFFSKLTEATTILQETKKDEMVLLSNSFRKMYEYWAADLLVHKTAPETPDEVSRMEEEIDRQALRFKLYAVRQLLFPFVEKEQKYINLPDIYKSRLLDGIICASSVKELTAEWQIIPKKLNALSALSKNPQMNKLPVDIQKLLIEKITLAHNESWFAEKKNKVLTSNLDDNSKDLLLKKIDLAQNDASFTENKNRVFKLLIQVRKIKEHENYDGLTTDQEIAFYNKLINTKHDDIESTIENIFKEISDEGNTWFHSIRKITVASKRYVSNLVSYTAESLSSVITPYFNDTDLTPDLNGQYSVFSTRFVPTQSATELDITEQNVASQLRKLTGPEATETDQLIGTLEEIIQRPIKKTQSTEPEEDITGQIKKTLKAAFLESLKKDKQEEASSPNSNTPPKKNPKS